MKPIILDKRKYNWKDIFRFISILLLHISAFYGYTFLLIYIGDLMSGHSFHFSVDETNWGILYPLTFGPIVSALAHIIYAETGKTNIRAFIWIHDMTFIIVVPVLLLIGI